MAKVTGDDGTPSEFTPTSPFGVWGDSGDPKGRGIIGSNPLIGVQGVSLEKEPVSSKPAEGAGVRGDGRVGVAGFTIESNSKPFELFVGVFGSASKDEDPGKLSRGIGVLGHGDGVGVRGNTREGAGVFGDCSGSGVGVAGQCRRGPGVVGLSDSAPAILGDSQGQVAVLGQCGGPGGVGVRGECSTPSGTGVIGIARNTNSVGVIGIGERAAVFSGDVNVTGKLTQGGGGFAIDHPLNPQGRCLNHAFVESQERKNLYDGIVSCDDSGEAIVDLPDWFEPLNDELRYQLTPIGRPAPDLHVSAKVTNGSFKIAGGAVGLQVSWQLTGVRQDAWAKSYPIAIEEDKAPGDQGYFLHPEVHGHTIHQGIHRAYYEDKEGDFDPEWARNFVNLKNQQP